MTGGRHEAEGTFTRRAGLCALFFALGCSVYDASLIQDGDGRAVPNRPPSNTSSPDDTESLVFALNEVFLRQTAEMAASIGIDLDATVTTGRDNATCEPRVEDGEVVAQAVVDGANGIDNSIGTALLPTVGSALPCLEDNLALTQGRGVGTILLWVQGWNGLPNDASVTAMLTTAVDGTDEDPSLIGFGGSDPVNLVYSSGSQKVEAPDPGWDNQDSWFLDPVDFDTDESGAPSLDLPKAQQVDAYVSSGRLVVPLLPGTGFKLIAGDGSLPSDGAMTVTVNGGFMLGDISEDHRRLDRGLFVGRFSLEKLGETTPKIGMCALNATVIGTLLGQFADIQSSPEEDGTGAECDAFSTGVTFNGVAGQVAGLAAVSRPELTRSRPIAAVPANGCPVRRASTPAIHRKRSSRPRASMRCQAHCRSRCQSRICFSVRIFFLVVGFRPRRTAAR
ncbi:MAG: hypothetical protein JRD92_09595 [Deltaproteobacteria bacterium]|nr:hypothetical protein [Deltaproteobacteria bacterium]